MNTYRALTPQAEGVFGVGVVEYEFTPTEEQDVLERQLLELVPRTYLVMSDNFAAAPCGATVDLAYFVEIEAALIAGGHIVRVEDVPKPKSTAKKAKE